MGNEPLTSVHEKVYRSLRQKIMFGMIKPGRSFTIRGLAGDFGVSMTPIREATRRLVAEGALSMSRAGRINTPELTIARIEELGSLRLLLETELAVKALPRVHTVLIERLSTINGDIDNMIFKQDSVGYIQKNIEFHKTLYLRAQSPATLALLETVWLQSGPTIRVLYDRGLKGSDTYTHKRLLSALRNKRKIDIIDIIKADISTGLGMLLNKPFSQL